MFTTEQIVEAKNWLDEQRAVVHPGPIETIRRALALAEASVLPWNHPARRDFEPVEEKAKEIYEGFAFDGPGEKPAWVKGGNSDKQDEARYIARGIIAGRQNT